MKLDAYHTLGKQGTDEQIIKKSRFIGNAAPFSDEDAALLWLRSIRDAHKTASHHCYAYIIGANGGIMRYQDDGEPQGTAGIPILEVLRKNQLVNCAVVVTRYFGGVLLGAGGLTRAYSAAAAAAVRAAVVVCAEPSVLLTARVGYTDWDKVQNLAGKLPLDDMRSEYTDRVTFTAIVRESDLPETREKLVSLTDNRIRLQHSDPFHHLWPATEKESWQ